MTQQMLIYSCLVMLTDIYSGMNIPVRLAQCLQICPLFYFEHCLGTEYTSDLYCFLGHLLQSHILLLFIKKPKKLRRPNT